MKIEDIKINLLEDQTKPNIIIDSGLGGLYVLDELSKKYPVENFIYFCDNEFLPLGSKNPKAIIKRVHSLMKKIKELNPKSIIIACNTLDAIVGDSIVASFPSINVIRVIYPSIKEAEIKTKTKKIALLATPNTIESQKHMQFLLKNKNSLLYGVECINLAKSIEDDENIQKVFSEETKVLDDVEFDVLILGCTHYHFVEKLVKKKYPNAIIIDSAQVTVNEYIKNFDKLVNNKANTQNIYIIMTKEEDINEKYNELINGNAKIIYENI